MRLHKYDENTIYNISQNYHFLQHNPVDAAQKP